MRARRHATKASLEARARSALALLPWPGRSTYTLSSRSFAFPVATAGSMQPRMISS